MERKVFNQSGLPLRRTVDLLPEIFKTSTNDKFLSATLDALVQPGSLDRLSGYVGRSYGKTFNSSDIYLDVEPSLRYSYQLEPGVVVTDDSNNISRFYDYIDFKNQLKFFNNTNERDDQTTDQTHYTWNPPIDWDKFVNYREYYWLPVGPENVSVSGQAETIISSYRVRSDGQNEWIFFPDGLKRNPRITLYRGQTYEFKVNAPGDPFYIRTGNLSGTPENYNRGVTNNGAEVGTIIFEVPLNAPDQLYYQSGNNINRVGTFTIASISAATAIDIDEEIIGKQSYTSSNGVKFTNGLKIQFIGKVSPEKYSTSSWIVEGVGEAIRLIDIADLEIPPINNPNIEIVFDDGGFDQQPFDDASSYPTSKDYITINRASADKNPWSRYNRWFHRSVIEYAAELNGIAPPITENDRAKRPIIEFLADLKLFNHGHISKTSVDIIDTFTTDVFSTIEGSAGYNIDGIQVSEGDRILFTADTDPFVKNKIFQVKFITTQTSANLVNRTQISLIETDDTDPILGEAVIVSKGSINNRGRMFHYNGTDWVQSQTKTKINQSPKFEIFDSTGVSFGDKQKYETSTFTGSELVSYKIGSGVTDPELGFSLSYLNIGNSGDILFEADYETDSFDYQSTLETINVPVSSGFYYNFTSQEYANGWTTYTGTSQPIVQTITLSEDSNNVISTACEWTQTSNETVLIYIDGEKYSNSVTSEITPVGKIFSFPEVLTKGTVVTFKVISDQTPDRGFYEIPSSLEKNPLNDHLTAFTLGQANDHLASMIEVSSEFSGVFPGSSNLRDITEYRSKGKRFLKHSGLGILSLPLLCDKNINLIQSLKYASTEYEKFKNNFLKLSVELPYDQNSIVKFVDDIILAMTKNKINEYPFSTSDMIGSGAFKLNSYVVEDTGIKTFALSEKFDLSTVSSKAVYVYVNDEQLIHGFDYEFDSTFGFVNLLINLNEGDRIEVREYLSTAYNFIPETPTKLGLYKKFTPRIYTDDTFIDPIPVIQGHDGSITVAYGDFRDQALLELEKRIYNNIKLQYNPEIFDIDSLFGGLLIDRAKFSKEQVDQVIESEFLRWATGISKDLYINDFYQQENSFTYTYAKATDKTKTIKMPAFWRGIYNFIYDTDRPHTCPWEMLGFSEKPQWWEDEYGPAPYTNGNLILWEDLRDGLVRQGERQGINPRYARPDLLKFIPVNDEGKLVSPQEASAIIDYTLNRINDDFQFGDWSPTENAWRKSSSYPYALIIAASLLSPFDFISSNYDRKAVTKNILGQVVTSYDGAFVDLQAVVESANSAPLGLLTYVQNYLKSKSLSSDQLYDILSNIDVRLTHRNGGFVEKQRQQYILDSKNPKAKSSAVFVPPENYQIILNTGSPITTLAYSGVVIEKVDRGFKVYGYDKLNSYFNYYTAYNRENDPVISVGGVSEKFSDWSENKFYGKNTLVRYESQYYRVTNSHTSETVFDIENFAKLSTLPIVGSIRTVKRTNFNRQQPAKLTYNTIFYDIQSVVDFLLGYGEWLIDNGMVFDEFNKDLTEVNSWETAAKEFMFWTSHNWSTGALITLSPASAKVKIEKVGSVAENLLDSFYDYTILRSDGTRIDSQNIQVYRGYNEFYLTPLDPSIEGIFFAKINFVQKEHVTIFDDRTVFNDVIYDKGPGYRQERMKLVGFRTTDWDGDYTSPGFIFDDARVSQWQKYQDYNLGDIVQYRQYYYVSKASQVGTDIFSNSNWERLDSTPTAGLIANFDYRINQIEDYYEVGYSGIDDEEKNLARHSIGYQKRQHLENTVQDEVSQFRIYQGFIKDKGTKTSITNFFDKISKVDDDAIELKEEWAFLMGSYGGTAQSSELEFAVNQKDIKLNPQPVLINSTGLDKTQYQNYILVNSNDFTIGDSTYKFPVKNYKVDKSSAGYVYDNDVDYVVRTKDDLYNLSIEDLKDGSSVWVTFDNTGWDVLRFTVTDTIIVAISILDIETISIETNKPHGRQAGEIIGINNIPLLNGFWKVKSAGPTTILIDIAGYDEEPQFEESSYATISIFESLRVSSYNDLIEERFSSYRQGSKVWLDDNGSGFWEVVEKRNQYEAIDVADYGVSFPTGTGRAVVNLDVRNQIIVSNPGDVIPSGEVIRDPAVVIYAQGETGLIPIQSLSPNSNLKDLFKRHYGETLAVSHDGRWLIVGSPGASNIPSNYREQFNPSATYNSGDTVIYAGKLWRAKDTIFGDGSTIDLSSNDWEPATEHLANPLGLGLVDINQGYRNQGAIEIFEYDEIFNQYQLRHTLISPRPAHGEKYGSTISISKREGIEGTSGDVTLTVTSIDSTGGILSVSTDGETGLEDRVFSNISGTDISLPGTGATFDIVKTGGVYNVLVRSGGTRYAIGDRIKIIGSNLQGVTPFNDLIITVTNVTSSGEIVGSATYNNITGINSSLPTRQAVFRVSKSGLRYAATKIDAGLGYSARSIVRYESRLYACIKDTNIDFGVWSSTRTYNIGDVVKYPSTGSAYYTATTTSTGTIPTDSSAWEPALSIFPTDTDYWQPVTGAVFADEAVEWQAFDVRGDRIKYTAGSTIRILGSQLGGIDGTNDIVIFVNTINPDTSIDNYSFSGTAATGIVWSGTATVGERTFNDVTGEDVSEPGAGSIFNLIRSNGSYEAVINVAGTRYNVGDQIRILGTDLGGVEEAYYMVVGAPGSIDDLGRAYMYKFDGLSWKHLENDNFVGVYSSTKNYIAGSTVWYNTSYWTATSNVPAIPGNQPGVGSWEQTTPINHGILPSSLAYADDGSTVQQGLNAGDVEFLSGGALYGYSSSMTADGSLMVISAIVNDTASFENFKGNWKSTTKYFVGDTVRRITGSGTFYYNCLVDTINSIPETTPSIWQENGDSTFNNSGSVFIYERSADDTYQLIQTIDSDEIELEAGDELGYAVKLSKDGGKLFVSAPNLDNLGKDQGSVLIFNLVNGAYQFDQKLIGITLEPGERFGSNLDVSPDLGTLAISAEGARTFETTTFDKGNTTFDKFVTKFKDSYKKEGSRFENGPTGKVYVYNVYDNRYVLAEIFDQNLIAKEDFGKGLAVSNDYITVGSPNYISEDPAFDAIRIGRIQKFRRKSDARSWYPIRKQSDQINIDLIKNFSLYDKNNNLKIIDLDILDPFKGKILSEADQYIDFKTSYDPAVYNSGTNELTAIDSSQAWVSNKIGNIWWDVSKAKWTLYEQDAVSFRTGNWARLAYGSTIDVCEWVESDYLPSQWLELTDTTEGFSIGISGEPLYADDSAYSKKITVDSITGLPISTKYYFWVKNKTTIETNSNKKLSASDIASYIESPNLAGIPYAAIIDVDKISLYNLSSVLNTDEFLVNVQFYNQDKTLNLTHNEYQLLSENTNSYPNEILENKWIDSIIGEDIAGQSVPDRRLPEKLRYGISSRPRQGMFVNRNNAVNLAIEFINNKLMTKPFAEDINFDTLNDYDRAPSEIKRLYDEVKETDAELRFVATSKLKTAVLKANIVNGHINTVDIIDGGYGYKSKPNIRIVGSGSGAILDPVLNNQGSIIRVDVVNQGKKYSSASLIVRPYSVLVNVDSSVNGYWSIYSLDEKTKEFYRSATQSYDTRKFWNYTDWWNPGFNELSRISESIPGLYAEPTVDLELGELLRLDNYGLGGWAVLERVDSSVADILGKYRIVGRESGTIQIVNKFYNTDLDSVAYDTTQAFDSNKYDTSFAKEFRNILKAVKEDIFINELSIEWNNLFFSAIKYVFSEQLYVDWAFKTSLVSVTHNVGNLEQKLNYKNDNLESYQDYINEVKPYRTKTRKFISKYLNTDMANQFTSDFDLPPTWDTDTRTIKTISSTSLEVNQYPWKAWKDNNHYSVVDIKLVNQGSNYTSIPQIVFDGDGTGAKAQAYISNGKVSKIVLIDGGTGYTSAPTISIVGGVGTDINRSATAVAIIGDSKVRTFDVKMKFDRTSKEPKFKSYDIDEKFVETETFIAGNRQTSYILKYPSTSDRSKVKVTINGSTLLSTDYTISTYIEKINSVDELKSKLILNSAPELSANVTIVYEKHAEILDSLNRLDKYYKPTAGQLGLEKTLTDSGEVVSDYSQLITGIDYGGVIVQGATFDVGSGWDALPWFTEGWDSAALAEADYYFLADGTTTAVTLPSAPEAGVNINVYVKRAATGVTERIDYPTYDEYQLDPSIEDVPPATAIMNTFIGDGTTSTVILPQEANIESGDQLIFRPDTSDGSLTIGGRNNIDSYISGGSFSGMSPYTTATGSTAAEIVLDGDRFISPDQVPAPEENVPGQVLESLSIKVFHTVREGSPSILSRIYVSNGTADTYDIGQSILEKTDILVFVDKVKKDIDTDFIIDSTTNSVRFLGTVPPTNAIIEIFSISVGGAGILDYKEFVGDGTTRYFMTGAGFNETVQVYATVENIQIPVGFVDSEQLTPTKGKTLVEFGVAPELNKKIVIIVLSTDQRPLVRINQHSLTVLENEYQYPIPTFSGLDVDPSSDMIVELNGQLLKTVDTTYKIYDGNPVIPIGLDTPRPSGTVTFNLINVFVNNQLKDFGQDYNFNSENNEVTFINQPNIGDIVRIEDRANSQYSIDGTSIVLNRYKLDVNPGDLLSITWFDRYTELEIIKDEILGGKVSFTLQRPILGVSYLWVYKNGERLTPDIDFYVDLPRTLYLRDDTETTDLIEVISFGTELYKSPLSFEIFKDVLNRTHYNTYSISDVKLTADLHYYDDELTVTDSTTFPDPVKGQPGIITINGEKIQYLSKDGNTLKNLRRGLFGTAIASVYPSGTTVVNTSFSTFVPYADPQEKEEFISDGTSQIVGPLSFVPRKTEVEGWFRTSIPSEYGRADEIEVFVGGRRLRKDSTTVYDSGLGAYSPAGDRAVEAEFSVDGTGEYIRLTSAVPAGTRITIVRKLGRLWYERGSTTATNGRGLSYSNTPIAKFLQNTSTNLPE